MRFGVLGPMQVLDGDRHVDVGGPQPRTVLAVLLAAEGAVVASDALIDAVWGQRPPPSAPGTLHDHVSRLRSRLGDSAPLVPDRAGYRLAVGPGDVDFRCFEDQAARGRDLLHAGRTGEASDALAGALRLWRGAAFADLADVAAVAAVAGVVRRLEDRRLAAVDDRIAADLALGRHAAVIGELEELVVAHPFRQSLVAHLALAQYRAGRQADALRTVDEARRRLVEELGVHPGSALRQLEAAIVAQDQGLDLPCPPVPATGPQLPRSQRGTGGSAPRPPQAPPPADLWGRWEEAARATRVAPGPGTSSRSTAFVGRDTELEALVATAEAGGCVLLIRGPAGIGKSRLARELGSRVTARGGVTLVGRASSAQPAVAFRPLREALLSAARRGIRPGSSLGPFVPSLAALVPEWGMGPASTTESPLLLGEAVLRLLASLGRPGRPAALVVDDLQWADPETLAVLDYLADNLEGSPVVVVATVRDGEPGPGAALADALVRRRVAHDLALRPLDRLGVLQVARDCLPGDDLPDEVSDVLVARSEGLPFLVEELVATALSAGWDSVAAAVPGSVVASVELRLEPLPPAARDLLTAAALLGRHFDWLLAAEAAGLSADEAAGHLRRALDAQLVDVDVDGTGFRFRHALTRDAVLAIASPADVTVAATRALDALRATGGELTGDRCVLAAGLAERLGRWDDAAGHLLAAAQESLVAGALASADLLATRARDLASDTATADRSLVEIAVQTGDSERARRLGRELLEASADPPARAELHLLIGSAELAAGRWSDAEERADAAVAEDPSDTARRARARALAAQAAMSRDDVAAAVDRARAALDGARATGQVTVECEALEVLGRVERGRDLEAAEAAFQQAHDLAAAAGLALWRVRALQELGTIDMFDSLDLDRLVEARRQAESLGALSMVALIDLQLSAVHDERAEVADALAAARRCAELSRRLRLSTLPMALLAEAKVHARRGDRAAMDAAIEQALATGEDRDNAAATVWGNVEPIFHLVNGDLRAAAASLDRAMGTLRPRPVGATPFPGLWALLRTVLDDHGADARAEVQALAFDTPVSRRTLVAAEAVALGRAGDREGAAARFAEADTALRKHGFGLRHGLVRLVVAPAARADGWGDPEGWLRGALAGFERLELDALAGRCRAELRRLGAPVPRRSAVALTGAVPPELAALGVTAREVDVLALVAAGATNRQVAERLVLSTRTVDKHVERLLHKTGTTRRGLAEVARRAGVLAT